MIFEKVRAIICEQLDLEESKITLDTCLADVGADSLDLVDLAMTIEDEFEVELPDEELEKVKSVSDLVRLLEKR